MHLVTGLVVVDEDETEEEEGGEEGGQNDDGQPLAGHEGPGLVISVLLILCAV